MYVFLMKSPKHRKTNHLFMPKDRRLSRLSFDDLPPALQRNGRKHEGGRKTITRLFLQRRAGVINNGVNSGD